MKKNLTIYSFLFIFLAFSFNSFASFPVKKKVKKTELVKENIIEKEATVEYAPVQSSGKSQVAALLLCLFVGTLGIHRFYLGYTWQGVVQLLTLGGLGIWTLIDLIRIITGDLQPKNGSYSKTF